MRLLLPLVLVFSTVLAAGCGGNSHRLPEEFNTQTYKPFHASGFDIQGAEDQASTLISVHNPWQGAGNIQQMLLVLRNDEQAPEGFTGQVVKAPVRHVVCMSSSHVAMFDAIGQVRRISGVSGADYISNEQIRKHRRSGEVRDVGYDTNLDFELLAAMRPDLILLYGVTGENTAITGKLRELGIPYIYIGDYMEESPLGKAEWLMIAAELCDLRDQGQKLFGQIARRYGELKASAEKFAEQRPRIMLNTPYRDTWFMPSSKSYMIRLIEDAGGEYIYKGNDSDAPVAINTEEAYLLANTADIWLNVGACNTLDELKAQNPKFADIEAVRARRVFNNNRRQTPTGGSDFWESGVVQPDRVLQDLIHILHGDGTDAGCHYYKRLE